MENKQPLTTMRNNQPLTTSLNASESQNDSNGTDNKRKASVLVGPVAKKEKKNKKKFNGLRMIAVEEFISEVNEVLSETGKPAKSVTELTAIFHKYEHVPSTPAREWSAVENRSLAAMLTELGFEQIEVVELNTMLPEGATMRNGSPVEEANVLVTRQFGQQLGINMDLLYGQLEGREMDKLKWSRRAKPIDKNGNPTHGQQNKLARHNCCITDAEEDGEAIEHGVRAGTNRRCFRRF